MKNYLLGLLILMVLGALTSLLIMMYTHYEAIRFMAFMDIPLFLISAFMWYEEYIHLDNKDLIDNFLK
jgi:hypothetical protein